MSNNNAVIPGLSQQGATTGGLEGGMVPLHRRSQ